MVDHRGCQKKQYGNRHPDLSGKTLCPKPVIHQKYGCHKAGCTCHHQVITHFYKRQQVGWKNNWAKQAIVGKIVNILPATQICCKFGKQLSGFIELLAELFRNYAMLGTPVSVGCKRCEPGDKKPYYKQRQDCEKNVWFYSGFHMCIPPFSVYIVSPCS